MKNHRFVRGLVVTTGLLFCLSVSGREAHEIWKGPESSSEVMFGGLFGIGVLDSTAGPVVIGTAAKKILRQGFVDDINDSVWAEVEFGPLFISGGPVWTYSLQMRWDFTKDEEWTFYGLGGLGGDITGSTLGSRFLLFPRFGAGVFWQFNSQFGLRAEISHELTALGVSFSM